MNLLDEIKEGVYANQVVINKREFDRCVRSLYLTKIF